MIDEKEHFSEKKTGWIKPENSPGKIQQLLKEFSSNFRTIIDMDKNKLLETTERLKNVLEKSRSKNTNT